MRRAELLLVAVLLAGIGVCSKKALADGDTVAPAPLAALGCNSCNLGCCSYAPCSSCCNNGCDFWSLLKQHDGIQFYGWLDAGFIGNTGNPNSKFNGPYNAVDRSNEPMFNQGYLVLEKELPCSGHGFGGRVDVLRGEDFFLAESIGLEKRADGSPRWNNEYYGIAIPQAYLNWGSRDLSVQVGHFYSVVGYEGVMAPTNFFYSKSYSYQFAGPFTHWGGQINWSPSDPWTIQLGVHNGWDALDRETDRLGFIGKVRYDSPDSRGWTSFAIVTGDEVNNAAGLAIVDDVTNRTRYSLLAGLPLTCRLDYVFHHWLGTQQGGALDGGQADWYGIDQYLYYRLNRCWKTGMRFEWFRDHDGTRVGLNRAQNPNTPSFAGNFYSATVGLNWTPSSLLTVRPEFRADWYDGNAVRLPYDDGANNAQYMLGIDAILQF